MCVFKVRREATRLYRLRHPRRSPNAQHRLGLSFIYILPNDVRVMYKLLFSPFSCNKTRGHASTAVPRRQGGASDVPYVVLLILLVCWFVFFFFQRVHRKVERLKESDVNSFRKKKKLKEILFISISI